MISSDSSLFAKVPIYGTALFKEIRATILIANKTE